MPRKFWSSLLLCLPLLAAAADVKVVPDRALPLYKCGEQAEFTVSGPTSGTAQATLFRHGNRKAETYNIDFSRTPDFTIKTTLNEPGFMRLAVSSFSGIDTKQKSVEAGIGFEPEKIKSAYALPADFMAFWEQGRKALAGEDCVQLEKLAKFSNDKQTTYYVTVNALDGHKRYGFLSIPTGKGPFPAYCTFPGAGPGWVGPVTQYPGVITLVMNVHDYPPVIGDAAAMKKLYADKNTEMGHSYNCDRPDSLEGYYFRNGILAMDRMINYIAALPQWDKKHFVMFGSSQGGAHTFIMCGFNRHLTAAAANVPAMCDLGGDTVGRQSGWPQVQRNVRSTPELAPAGLDKVNQVLPYYDAANFARFIRIPILVSCGFIDNTCSPESVYAAYNNIPAKGKRFINMPLAAHAIPQEWKSAAEPWILKHLGLKNR